MQTSRVLGYAVVLLCAAGCAQSGEQQFVVLPPREAKAVTELCSRSGPLHIEGGWTPNTDDVASLEAHLGEISKISGGSTNGIANPLHYFRQYVGIIVNGRRQIYVNAIDLHASMKDVRTRFANVCDGGSAFWGVIFDPLTSKFSDFQENGQL